MGTTGEYSDMREWPVMAYLDEAEAREHVVKASRRAEELFAIRGDKTLPKQNEFDHDMIMAYTGTFYFIYTAPIANSLEQALSIFEKYDVEKAESD